MSTATLASRPRYARRDPSQKLSPEHSAQVITYLKITGCRVGLLFNFNVPVLRQGILRLLHPSLCAGRLPTSETGATDARA